MACKCKHCREEITPEDKRNGWFYQKFGQMFCSATCANLWDIERRNEIESKK